ncbi:hypothetical protein Mal64_21030 [Pseudobythopirellula maris]|uniref:Uncharacterized protein n=1 Tax=Pseudobythopirellula maris TaxID=2527991 RepID=A0A5C5ZN82_9BACT|nr:hypothetical protein Mal64_21030 [Pseudobythopirellula maris]
MFASKRRPGVLASAGSQRGRRHGEARRLTRRTPREAGGDSLSPPCPVTSRGLLGSRRYSSPFSIANRCVRFEM